MALGEKDRDSHPDTGMRKAPTPTYQVIMRTESNKPLVSWAPGISKYGVRTHWWHRLPISFLFPYFPMYHPHQHILNNTCWHLVREPRCHKTSYKTQENPPTMKNYHLKDKEVAERLRMLAALTEVRTQVQLPSPTLITAIFNSSFRGSNTLFGLCRQAPIHL